MPEQAPEGSIDGARLLTGLVGDDLTAPCVDGRERTYLSLDAAASTSALPAVAERIADFLPRYSSVHRGAGWKSQLATAEYEEARAAALAFAGKRPSRDDVAVFCRNTTEAVNHLAYRLRLAPDDVVVTTVVEHHANLLPWARLARRRYVECGPDGTFDVDDVAAALDDGPRPRLLAITGASNVTGWMPPIDEIVAAAHERGVPVLVDAAQLAAHRPLPGSADFLAWSGHKMYAPYGGGVLVGPRSAFETGDPFLAGGGAVDLVDLDEVVWTDPPEREEAGSPNVIGAVALHAAIDELARIGWPAIIAHDDAMAAHLRHGPGRHRRRPPAGPRRRDAHPAPGHVRGRRRPPRPGRGPAQRGARHRRPPRVLLRPPLPPPPARPRLRRGGVLPRRPSSGATAATSRARSGPAPGSRPPQPTSTASWPPSPTSPAAANHPCPTTRTRTPATTGPAPPTPTGPAPPAAPAPLAPAARTATRPLTCTHLDQAADVEPDDEACGDGLAVRGRG